MDILIVETTAIINARLKSLIAEANSKAIIYQAKTYDEAIKLLTEEKIDLVVLDSGLPENMSVNLLKEIKVTKNETPVIVLSTNMDAQIRQKYTHAGADFYLDKYYEFEKIVGIINLRCKKE